jgi:hypothetical protein
LLDNGVRYDEPQSSPFFGSLSGKEGFENPRENVVGNADPSIANLDLDIGITGR